MFSAHDLEEHRPALSGHCYRMTGSVAVGGRHALDPQDHGFMYGWSFYDPDGHHWEVLWMDPKTIAQ